MVVCRSTALMMCTPANVAPPSVTTNAAISIAKAAHHRPPPAPLHPEPCFFGACSRPVSIRLAGVRRAAEAISQATA